MAFAMAGVPTLLPHEKMAATINAGSYQGSYGSQSTRRGGSRRTRSSRGIAYGPDEKIVGGRAGLRVGW